ncbi:hypothetical protein NUSPORA_01308 [Nucleospora cyclopteri]
MNEKEFKECKEKLYTLLEDIKQSIIDVESLNSTHIDKIEENLDFIRKTVNKN